MQRHGVPKVDCTKLSMRLKQSRYALTYILWKILTVSQQGSAAVGLVSDTHAVLVALKVHLPPLQIITNLSERL